MELTRKQLYPVVSGGLVVGVAAALGVSHYLALCLWDINAHLIFEGKLKFFHGLY